MTKQTPLHVATVWSHGVISHSRSDSVLHNQLRHFSSTHIERFHPAYLLWIEIRSCEVDEKRIVNAYPGIHVDATHGTLGSQFLCRSRKVADHVSAAGFVVNGGGVHRVFPKEIIVESQMSQRDRTTTFQGETSIRISSLGKLSVQVVQDIEMRVEFGDQSSRPLKPER